MAVTRRSRTTSKKRSRRRTRKAPDLDPVSMRLEFLAGLMALPPDADEQDRIAIADLVGLDSAAVARIFKKTPGAASMAMLRARRKSKRAKSKKRR